MAKRKKLLIVDGYNAIRSGSRYQKITLPDFTDDYYNVCRERLLKDVIDFAGRNMDAIIVYDAADRVGQASKTETVGGVKVVFSHKGQSADHVIEKLAHEAREHGIETLVVTSDATVQDTVFGLGVDRMSAEGFCQELGSLEESRSEKETVRSTRKSTVADRIPEDVLAKLRNMRDA